MNNYKHDVLYFRSDFDKLCILNTFERLGFERIYNDDWNVYWANKGSTKMIFRPETGIRLSDDQIINHFPNHYQLTRKDLMVKNIKRYCRDMNKESMLGSVSLNGKNTNEISLMDFIPSTYILPTDYSLFYEEFKSCKSNQKWIMKPIAKSRGIGIFIVTKLSQVKGWSNQYRSSSSSSYQQKEQYVCSKYIDNPMLIGQKKFDLRLYCLVTSYRPLKCYMFKQGFCRFCTYEYTNDNTSLENMYVHLTNVAIQKTGKHYNDKHGGKWSFTNFLFYVQSTRGEKAMKKLMNEIHYIVIQSLKACKQVISNDKHCFEVYGYDIMIDDSLHPWLLEINGSPSLTSTTKADRILKTSLINDTFKIVIKDDFPDVSFKDYKYDDDKDTDLGDYYVLYDELNDYHGDLPNYMSHDNSKRLKNESKHKRINTRVFRI